MKLKKIITVPKNPIFQTKEYSSVRIKKIYCDREIFLEQ